MHTFALLFYIILKINASNRFGYHYNTIEQNDWRRNLKNSQFHNPVSVWKDPWNSAKEMKFLFISMPYTVFPSLPILQILEYLGEKFIAKELFRWCFIELKNSRNQEIKLVPNWRLLLWIAERDGSGQSVLLPPFRVNLSNAELKWKYEEIVKSPGPHMEMTPVFNAILWVHLSFLN